MMQISDNTGDLLQQFCVLQTSVQAKFTIILTTKFYFPRTVSKKRSLENSPVAAWSRQIPVKLVKNRKINSIRSQKTSFRMILKDISPNA